MPASDCWQGRFLLRTVREKWFHASLPASGGLLATFAGPWLIAARSPSVHCFVGHSSFIHVSVSKLTPFIRTLLILDQSPP